MLCWGIRKKGSALLFALVLFFTIGLGFFPSINLRVELNLGKTMTVVCKNKTTYMNTWN